MRKIVLIAGALALVSMSGIAAADGRREPVAYAPTSAYNWSGVYFGSHIGGGWGDVDSREDLSVAVGGVPLLQGTQTHSTSGWLAGVQLGAMKQFGSFVFGTEFSLSGADINGSGGNCFGITAATGGIVGSNCDTTINWLLTGLGRAGFAWDRWMVYGALGYAVAGVEHSISLSVPGVQFNSAQQDVTHGVAFGGGLEFALSKDFTLGVQYLHANLESRGEGLLLGGVLSTGRRDIDLDTVTARLSYKWGGDCCAVVPMK